MYERFGPQIYQPHWKPDPTLARTDPESYRLGTMVPAILGQLTSGDLYGLRRQIPFTHADLSEAQRREYWNVLSQKEREDLLILSTRNDQVDMKVFNDLLQEAVLAKHLQLGHLRQQNTAKDTSSQQSLDVSALLEKLRLNDQQQQAGPSQGEPQPSSNSSPTANTPIDVTGTTPEPDQEGDWKPMPDLKDLPKPAPFTANHRNPHLPLTGVLAAAAALLAVLGIVIFVGGRRRRVKGSKVVTDDFFATNPIQLRDRALH